MRGWAVPVLSCLLMTAASLAIAQAAAGRPGREISLPPTAVKDTFFAYVLGIIQTGVEVDIDNAGMRDILTEFKSTLKLPFDLVNRVTQHTADQSTSIGLDFDGEVSIPIPFALLGYHPGSINSSPDLSFGVTKTVYQEPSAADASSPVFALTLQQGTVLVNIDDWLEALFPSLLEDTWVRHIIFFVWKGQWVGLLEGRGQRDGREMRAYFNFTGNRILFPIPAELDRIGRRLVNQQVATAR
ncbi:MAG TPA: hypothetical protein VFH83_10770 [Spirochaetia bacterium]|nr:hypothetical protein [Spirochaetia bacterium]